MIPPTPQPAGSACRTASHFDEAGLVSQFAAVCGQKPADSAVRMMALLSQLQHFARVAKS
jgi:hypothetical protein